MEAPSSVTFNINPSFERPTATVDRPKTKRLGFTFEYAMVRPYPCFMRVEFADGGAPLSIEYRVSDAKAGERRIARRIAIDPRKLKGQKPQGQARQRKGVATTIDLSEGARSVWVEG